MNFFFPSLGSCNFKERRIKLKSSGGESGNRVCVWRGWGSGVGFLSSGSWDPPKIFGIKYFS